MVVVVVVVEIMLLKNPFADILVTVCSAVVRVDLPYCTCLPFSFSRTYVLFLLQQSLQRRGANVRRWR